MVIRLIGILTSDGVPVAYESFMEESDVSVLISSLLSAVHAIAEALGEEEVSSIDFRRNKLIMTKIKKNYVVFAIAHVAEEYIDALLRVIAHSIDNDDSIFPPSGFVDSYLENKMIEILQQYVSDGSKVNYREIIDRVWRPISGRFPESAKNRISEIFKSFDSLYQTAEEEWTKYFERSSRTLEEALKHAFNGDYLHACSIALKMEDRDAKLFGVKMGIPANTIYGSIAPPMNLLEKIVVEPLEDIFSKLIRMEIGLILGEVAPDEYLEVFREAVKSFSFNDDKALLKAFLFLGNTLMYELEFGAKLREFFSEYSDVISSLISNIFERTRIINWAYSHTKLGEIEDYLRKYESELESSLSELRRVTEPRFLERLIGLVPKGKYDYELAIISEDILETLLRVIDKHNLEEYGDVAKEILDISVNALRKYGLEEKAGQLIDRFGEASEEVLRYTKYSSQTGRGLGLL